MVLVMVMVMASICVMCIGDIISQLIVLLM